ncbi:type II toxin-antitoxin system HicA family toxin [Sphingomonas hankyongi]|uniref:type II toxin-antitoxin system HicA family toxin n=1 Tax=Sphingomonas hankyongi TaxID=2908209 RepID=UPI003D32E835
MNRKQRRVLAAIFRKPTSATIAWDDIEGLFVALGCEVIEGNGARVRFAKDDMIATFHRPHPDKEAKKYQVEDARAYLTRLGLEP